MFRENICDKDFTFAKVIGNLVKVKIFYKFH